jgi:hypothetical protein
MCLIIFASFVIIGGTVIGYHPSHQEVNAPPPAAAIGMHTHGIIQHVTFRMDISKDGKHLLSDFFRSYRRGDHTGEVRLMFKDKGGSSSSHTIGGNQDVLTNAWIADPGSPMTISGPVFNQSGTYNINLELSTIDNDKTDLVEPLDYHFDVNVS